VHSREQVAEGTACLRFGQSCLSMSVNPSANKLEKEQAEMRAVIAEQLQEIADLQSENENLKLELERAKVSASARLSSKCR
jgi:regulator of replication initiation timing